MSTGATIDPAQSRAEVLCEPATASQRLHRRLSPFDTLLLTLSCLSLGFSVYGPGSDVLQHTGTGAAGLFLIGIGAAAVWGIPLAARAAPGRSSRTDRVGSLSADQCPP